MAGIESLSNQALYFAAAQTSAQQYASQQAKKSDKTSKLSFADTIKKSQEEARLIEEGYPPEIAGMSDEQAVIFLKDEVDLAGDDLRFHQSLEKLESYRKKVSQFLKFISKNNYEVVNRKRMVGRGKTRRIDTIYQIQVINQSLNQLVTGFVYNHRRNLNLLAKIDEIKGLIIDLVD